MSALVNTNELYDWADCKQPAKLEEWLRDNHIPYRLNRSGKPITTLSAINGSLKSDDLDDEIEF